MRERPILFSGPMVQAIREGGKTQTRRVVKPQPELLDGAWYWKSPRYDNGDGVHYFHTQHFSPSLLEAWAAACPYGQPGDRLWVRETWQVEQGGYWVPDNVDGRRHYAADGGNAPIEPIPSGFRSGRWRPSIFMPRWASRLTLEITGIRVKRLQDISEGDAVAEGVTFDGTYWLGGIHPVKGSLQCWPTARRAFQALWDSINAARGFGWDTNPWVWSLGFTPIPGAPHAG